jgi:hypothetical protein
MAIPFRLTKDINGFPQFNCFPAPYLTYVYRINTGAQQNVAIPTEFPFYVAVFSSFNTNQVWAAVNATVFIPTTANTLVNSTTFFIGHSPFLIEVKGGDSLNFKTNSAGATGSIALYPLTTLGTLY